MNGEEPEVGPEGQLFSEAARWFARMRGPDTENERAAFERWLARGALHRSAYNRAAEVFAMGKLLDADEAPEAATTKRKVFRSRALVPAVAALVAAAGVGAAGWWWIDRSSPSQHVSAAAAEPATVELAASDRERSLRLPDGSVLRLAPGALVQARFDTASRILTLVRGMGRFTVAHEPRPFVVYAGGGSVTAHGTVFEVALLAGRQVAVRLIEGSVEVQVPDRAGTSAGTALIRTLHRGETLRFAARESARPAALPSAPREESRPSAAHVSSSAGEAREFDRIRVADLIALPGRGGGRPIRLGDSAIGDERVSGRFRIDDSDLLAERIAGLFDLTIDRSDPDSILLKRR